MGSLPFSVPDRGVQQLLMSQFATLELQSLQSKRGRFFSSPADVLE
jgi:hypothetical protein